MQIHKRKPSEGLAIGPRPDLGLTPTTDSAVDRGNLSRRNLLLTLGAVGVASVGGSIGLIAYRDEAAATEAIMDPSREHQWCRVVDLRRCTGERKCVSSCQIRHGLPPEQTWMRVLSWPDEDGGEHYMPVPCQMCENPPCQAVCPVSATFTNPQGVVLVDQETCIGSRACMAACPYEARYFNWADPLPQKRMPIADSPQMPVPQKGTVGKCVFCADRLPHGELPACVSGCPMGVLYMGDLVTDTAVNGQGTAVVLSDFLRANDAVRYKEELGTNPRVYYILGHGQSLGGGA